MKSIESAVLRRAIKERAKYHLRLQTSAMFAMLIAFLPSLLFSLFIFGISWEATVWWPYNVLTYVFDFFITAPLLFGLMGLYLGMIRKEKVSIFETISCFWEGKRYLLSLKLALALLIRSLIWSVLPMAAVSYGLNKVVNATGVAGQMNQAQLSIILSLLAAIICLPLSIKAFSYQAGYNYLLDHPEMGAWQATKRGSALFRGRLWELLIFLLSFCPWALFVVITSGIGLLFVVPYIFISFVLYVEELRGNGDVIQEQAATNGERE